MRKFLYALTIVGLLGVGTWAQQAGGAFFPAFAYAISGNWAFSGTNTHSGTETFTGTTSIASPTITGTVTNSATNTFSGNNTHSGNNTLSGSSTVTGRLFIRESFDQGYFIMQDDATAKSLTDNEINVVFGSPFGIITYIEDAAKTASSWLISDGVLDIAGDNTTDDEGVEIRFGAWHTTNEGVIVAQTSGACFSASITITDISGTDQFLIGWVQNEAYRTDNVYSSYNDWSLVGINNVDGSIFSLAEVNGGGTLSDDSGVNASDGDTRILKSCILANGTRTASYTANGGTTFTNITLANGTTAHTAGDQLVPMLTFRTAGTDGPNPIVNWVQLESLP